MMFRTRFFEWALVAVTVALLGGCSGGGTSDGDSADPERAFLEQVHKQIAGAPPSGSVAGAIEAGKDFAQIELETDVYEMGIVSNSGFTTKEMKVYNRGTAPLRISRVTTECPCTTGKMKRAVIPPGGTGVLEITIDPRRIPGFYAAKTLTLYTNDPSNLYPRVVVVSHVEQEIEVEPEAFNFGEIAEGQGGELTIRLRQLQEKPFVVNSVSVRGDAPYIAAEFEEVPESEWRTPGKSEYVLTARLLPDAPEGEYSEVIYAHTNLERAGNGDFGILFQAKVLGNYRVTPSSVSLKNVKPGETYEGILTISSDLPLEVLGFDHSNVNLEVVRRPGDAPNTYIFDLKVPRPPSSRLQRDTFRIDLKVDGVESTASIDVAVVIAKGY